MILPILAYGHPALKKHSEDIQSYYPDVLQLVIDMFETMDHAHGIGLAAPQINKNVRVVVINLDPFKEKHPEYSDFRKAYINLHIVTEEGDNWSYDEGCLSIPTINEGVVRKSVITIEYDDVNFVHHREVVDGMLARVLQHEHEHLEGHVFTENLSSLKRTIISKKLQQISVGRIRPNYKMVYSNR